MGLQGLILIGSLSSDGRVQISGKQDVHLLLDLNLSLKLERIMLLLEELLDLLKEMLIMIDWEQLPRPVLLNHLVEEVEKVIHLIHELVQLLILFECLIKLVELVEVPDFTLAAYDER